MTALFGGASSIRARALLLGDRLDIRALEATHRLAMAPVVVTAGDRGAAVLFKYGAVVLFHVSPLEEVGLLASLQKMVGDPYEKPDTEEVEVRVATTDPEGVEAGIIKVVSLSVERMQLIAEVMARSVALARYEATVLDSFERIEPWANALMKHGAGGQPEKDILKHMGSTLLAQQRVAGRIEINDKPELLWERPDLERLYARLEDEYELRERDIALDRKLELINRTANTLLGMLHNRRSNRLEWYIVILIVVEIVIGLLEKLAGAGS
jgi:uncharacterized Rmd1/YagE family protein